MRKSVTASLVVLAAAIVVTAPSAAADRTAPRMVAAVMQDADGDFRADRLRLTYSERVRHPRDADGRYPLSVSGYRIRSVGRASGRTIVIALVERRTQDDTAQPAIRYRRTKSKAVKDRSGNQAAGQTFRRTRGHGKRPPETPPPPPPQPQPQPQPPPPLNPDRDGDGYPNEQDCAPDDAAINPGAPDEPDLAFAETNCDGIDGAEASAIFVSPLGNDGNPGTRTAPMREIWWAIINAAAAGKPHVYAAGGTYEHVTVSASNVAVYGGYNDDWSRSLVSTTSIAGERDGMLLVGATNILLQHLTVRGTTPAGAGASTYGIRLINNSSAKLQRVLVSAGNGTDGASRSPGPDGVSGNPGSKGRNGSCDGEVDWNGPGGEGGSSTITRAGGDGGIGGWQEGGVNGDGRPGRTGQLGTPGGAGGDSGDPGGDGGNGADGNPGAHGANRPGGTSSTADATTTWNGKNGVPGDNGGHGNGGGGGGGGGAEVCGLCDNGDGNGGGGGGAGGGAGAGGGGGSAGGGSFGLYLHNSTVVVSDSSSVMAGNGGTGGRGGAGGVGGIGGVGGLGAAHCISEIGEGGDGGWGGNGGWGGGGGGGAGGPSIGVFKLGASTSTGDGSSAVASATPGSGGQGGQGAPGFGFGGTGATGIATAIYPP